MIPLPLLLRIVLGLVWIPTITSFSALPTPQSTTTALFSSNPQATTTEAPSRLKFPGIEASGFRHPFDRNLTELVERLPFITVAEQGLRQTFPILEQGVRLDLLSTSVKVSPTQLPHVYKLLQDACEILDLETTELYVQSNSQANAYTLAFQGKDAPPIVVVTSALLDKCTDAELQAVIGHELGHLKSEHSLYLTLGSLASTPLRPLAGRQIDDALQRWRLAAEYTCDRAALMVAQDVNVVNSALIKLVSGTAKYDIDVDSFVQQCQEYESLLQSANPLVRASVQRQVRTHPLPVRRVSELKKWSESEEYADLLVTGVGLE